MPTVGSLLSQLGDTMSNISTFEWRVAVSGAVVVLTLLVTLAIAPVVVRWSRRVVKRQLLGGPLASVVTIVDEYLPMPLGGLALRAIQLLVLVPAMLALWTIWELIEPVADLVQSIGLSIDVFGQLGLTVAVAGVIYVVADQYKQAVARIGQQASWMTDHQQEIVIRMGQIVILLFGALVMLGLWGIELQGLLVGAGFLGIVVGLAARQTLGSLIAGFVLMFSRPFTIGDWVEIGGEEGIVTDITIINTRLENFDGEVVVMPNDRVSNEAIINRSKRGVLRLMIDVGIDYDSDPEHAKSVALEAIKEVNSVADGPPPQIVPKSFGDSAIVLEMRFWIDHPTPPRKWNAISGVVTNVKEAFEREGIKIPFPQRELTGRAETGGFKLQGTADAAASESADTLED